MNVLQGDGLLADRVEQKLYALVANMTAAGETFLPKEQELAQQYDVSLKTIRTALKDLKLSGVLRPVPGKGTFIVPATDRQRLTLVICRNITHPVAAVTTQTILNALRERGMPATISVVENGRSDWPSLGFSPRDIGGVVALGSAMDPTWLAEMRRDGVPVAVLGDFAGTARQPPVCHQVIPDSHAATFLATRHLLQTGHRHILMACWGGDSAWGRDLTRGYRESLEEAGIPYDPAFVLSPPNVHVDPSAAHYIEEFGEMQESIDQLLSGPHAPTAVIHNSSLQAQAQAMLHSYFHDRFDLANAVALSHSELLESGYRNGTETWAVSMPFRDLVNMALDLLADKNQADTPALLTVDKYRLWHRTEGQWCAAPGI